MKDSGPWFLGRTPHAFAGYRFLSFFQDGRILRVNYDGDFINLYVESSTFHSLQAFDSGKLKKVFENGVHLPLCCKGNGLLNMPKP